MADRFSRFRDPPADPRGDRRQPDRSDRTRRGPAACAAGADRRRDEQHQDADVHVQPRPCRRTWSTTPCSPRPGAGSTVKLLIDGFGSAAPPRLLRRPRRSAAAIIACSTRATAAAICCAITRSWSSPTTAVGDHRRRQYRRHLSDDRGAEALARPVAADRRARGRASPSRYFDALFRWSRRKKSEAALAAADGRRV